MWLFSIVNKWFQRLFLDNGNQIISSAKLARQCTRQWDIEKTIDHCIIRTLYEMCSFTKLTLYYNFRSMLCSVVCNCKDLFSNRKEKFRKKEESVIVGLLQILAFAVSMHGFLNFSNKSFSFFYLFQLSFPSYSVNCFFSLSLTFVLFLLFHLCACSVSAATCRDVQAHHAYCFRLHERRVSVKVSATN